MPVFVYIAVIVIGVVLAAVFAGLETAIYTLDRFKLRLSVAAGKKDAERVARLLRSENSLLSATLVSQNAAIYVASAFVTGLLIPVTGHYAELISTLALAPLLFVLVEVLPKTFFRSRANEAVATASRLLFVSLYVLYPAVIILQAAGFALQRIAGLGKKKEVLPAITRHRIEALLEEGRASGAITSYQGRMFANAVRTAKMPIEDVMVPLKEMTSAPAASSVGGFLRAVGEKGFSRVPLCEGAPASVTGVVHIARAVTAADASLPVAVLASPPFFIMKGTMLDSALLAMKRKGERVAFVVDEKGSVLGLVSIKDILAEVVGELR